MSAQVETTTGTNVIVKPTAITHLVLITANAIQVGMATGEHAKVSQSFEITKRWSIINNRIFSSTPYEHKQIGAARYPESIIKTVPSQKFCGVSHCAFALIC